MLESVVRDAMPMEKLGLVTFSEMLDNSRNSEIAILGVYHACFLKTKNEINIEWCSETAFGTWWKRIQKQRKDAKMSLASKFLLGVNISDCKIF